MMASYSLGEFLTWLVIAWAAGFWAAYQIFSGGGIE